MAIMTIAFAYRQGRKRIYSIGFLFFSGVVHFRGPLLLFFVSHFLSFKIVVPFPLSLGLFVLPELLRAHAQDNTFVQFAHGYHLDL